MNIEIPVIGNQLAAAAANGLYQGIVITVVVALTLRVFSRTNAATRHAIWFGTLLLLVSLIFAHCLISSVSASRKVLTSVVSIKPRPELDTFLPNQEDLQNTFDRTRADSAVSLADQISDREAAMSGKNSKALPFTQTTASEAREKPMAEIPLRREESHGNELAHGATSDEALAPNIPTEAAGFHWLFKRFINPVSVKVELGSNLPKMASLVLLTLWLTIAGCKVIALVLQLIGIQKLKHLSYAPSAELSELFHKLAAQLAVNRKVELRISTTQRSSLLLGFLRPVILLPTDEHLAPADAELVLRHELAHLRRRDDWVNLVQHFILATFFFHPAIWWISRQLSLEREIACDDHVLQQNQRPQAYALLLANLASRMQGRLPLLAPGSSNNKTQLKERIDMILNKHRNTSPRLAKTWLALITSGVTLITIIVICSAPRIVLAQNGTTPAVTKTPSADAPTIAPEDGTADTVPQTTTAPVATSVNPKFKSESSSTRNKPQAVIATPAVPSALPTSPTDVAPIARPAPILAGNDPALEFQTLPPPRPVSPPSAGNINSSLEMRLEHLEQMVASLMNQQNHGARFEYQLKAEKDGMIDQLELAKIDAFTKRQAEFSQQQMMNAKSIAKIKKQAELDAALAAEQVERAEAGVEKTVRADQETQAGRKFKDGPQRQLEVLRKQLEILERQKDTLDRQIEKLEQEQEEPNER